VIATFQRLDQGYFAFQSLPLQQGKAAVLGQQRLVAGLYSKSRHTRCDMQSCLMQGVARRVIVHAGYSLPSS
jgi:hypothetical protein